MTVTTYFLFTIYSMELIAMIVAMGYVACLFMQKRTVMNKHLRGRRLKVAALLPVLWFIYTYSDAYVVYSAGESVQWKLPQQAIWVKIALQTLSMVGGFILALFVMGCKFGDK